MRLEYRLTQADVLDGLVLPMKWRRWAIIVGVAVAVLSVVSEPQDSCGCVSVALTVRSLVLPAIAGFAFGAGMVAAVRFLLLPRLVSRTYRENVQIYGDMSIEIGEDGLEVTTQRSQVRFAWGELQDFLENSHVFVIRVSRSLSFAVSKRGQAADRVSQFRDLLAARLKRGG